jgi:hypothetical protein
MWFAKFFGGRVAADDEPARFATPDSAKARQPVRRVQGDVSNSVVKPAATARKAGSACKGGFDPYNSGSFERGNAWERVIRR